MTTQWPPRGTTPWDTALKQYIDEADTPKAMTAAQWAAANTLLASGEQGYETDTGRLKVGNGTDVWADLDYYDEHVAQVVASSTAVVDAAAAAVDASLVITGLHSAVNALASDIDAISSASAILPSIPNLFFHLDATTITAADGDRLAAWTDEVTGTVQVSQADAAIQPRYDIAGINGRPAVYFDGARSDYMFGATGSATSLTPTVFIVAKNPAPTGVNYLMGLGRASGNRRSIYLNEATINMQGLPAFGGQTVYPVPHVYTSTFNGASSVVRVDGVTTTGDTGSVAASPIEVALGNRISPTAGQFFTGHIAEVLWYDRALTTGECESVERYLAAKWGIPVTPQSTWYVNTMGGNDANTGRSSASPVASIVRAWQGIAASKAQNATILIHAPESKPLRIPTGGGLIKADGGTVRLAPLLPGDTWHLYGTERVDSGWTDAGGGVWTRPLTSIVSAPIALVKTMLDTDGQPLRMLTRNTASPLTPAEGEFGFSAGTYAIHLPGGDNPNLHVIEIVVVLDTLTAKSGSQISLDRGHLLGAQNIVVRSGSTVVGEEGGFVDATDCIADLSLIAGWATLGATDGMKATRTVGRYSANDGFNHHGSAGNTAVMELIDCEGAYNRDEGVSPHDDTVLVLRGGRFHHNGFGGLTSVGNAITYVYGTEFDHNRTRDTTITGWDSGGVSILEQSKLISTDLYSHDHPGPGVEIETAAGATWTDNGGTRSGTANGNAAEDAM